MARPWLPPLLLAAYAFAFAWRALGGGLLIVDDHPGQLYRLARVVELGPWPWRLDPGWWAGYAELQYYPPGAAYLGAVLQVFSLGALGPDAAYQTLLWVIYVLPGATTYLLLVRVLGRPWLALPGAFLALTLSGGSRSGVEEGLRWGLIAARLGWSLLPLLALSLRPWTARAKPPLAAALILASIILIHPAHAPAGLVLVFLCAAEGPAASALEWHQQGSSHSPPAASPPSGSSRCSRTSRWPCRWPGATRRSSRSRLSSSRDRCSSPSASPGTRVLADEARRFSCRA